MNLQRWGLNCWRNPYDVLINVARAVLLGLILGTTFYNIPFDPRGVSERFAVLFFTSLYADLIAFAYLPMVFFQRPIFYRERSERMYHTVTVCPSFISISLHIVTTSSCHFTFMHVTFQCPFYSTIC